MAGQVASRRGSTTNELLARHRPFSGGTPRALAIRIRWKGAGLAGENEVEGRIAPGEFCCGYELGSSLCALEASFINYSIQY
jgi:hypothetical protein